MNNSINNCIIRDAIKKYPEYKDQIIEEYHSLIEFVDDLKQRRIHEYGICA